MKRKYVCLKPISILLVLTLSITQTASAYPLPFNTITHPISPVFQNPDRPFRIPSRFGSVDEIYRGSNGKFIALIQDAHTNYNAQKNISGLIQFLTRTYDISTVALEGAQGLVDTDTFRSFPSRRITHDVLDRYVRKGELGGPQLSVTINPRPLRLVGIDEDSLYRQNLRELLDVLEIQRDGLRWLAQLKRDLRKRSGFISGEDSIKFDNLWRNWKNGIFDLRSFVSSLLEVATKCRLNSSRFKYLTDFSKTLNDLSVKRPADLGQLEKINVPYLVESIDALRFEIKYTLAKSKEESELIRLERYADLFERGLKLELSRREVKEFRLLSKKLGANKVSSPYVFETAIFAFYKTAQKRDELFVKRLRKDLESRLEKSAILTCGGFHREGVAKLLKKAGYSYAVITPKIRQRSTPENYFRLMRSTASLLRYADRNTLGVRIPFARNTFADTKLLAEKILGEEINALASNPKRGGFRSLDEAIAHWQNRGDIIFSGERLWSLTTIGWALNTWGERFSLIGLPASQQKDKLVRGLELFSLNLPKTLPIQQKPDVSGFGSESVNSLAQTLRTSGHWQTRWSALNELSRLPSAPERNKVILFALSDPHTMNRHDASDLLSSTKDFPDDLLLKFIRSPVVPPSDDPRMGTERSKYSLEMARRNARYAGLYALRGMLGMGQKPDLEKPEEARFNGKLAQKLRAMIRKEAAKWVAAGQNEIENLNPTEPLGTPESLSLFNILRIFIRNYQFKNQIQLYPALAAMDHVEYHWVYQAAKRIYPNIPDDPVSQLIYVPINDYAAQFMQPNLEENGFGAENTDKRTEDDWFKENIGIPVSASTTGFGSKRSEKKGDQGSPAVDLKTSPAVPTSEAYKAIFELWKHLDHREPPGSNMFFEAAEGKLESEFGFRSFGIAAKISSPHFDAKQNAVLDRAFKDMAISQYYRVVVEHGEPGQLPWYVRPVFSEKYGHGVEFVMVESLNAFPDNDNDGIPDILRLVQFGRKKVITASQYQLGIPRAIQLASEMEIVSNGWRWVKGRQPFLVNDLRMRRELHDGGTAPRHWIGTTKELERFPSPRGTLFIFRMWENPPFIPTSTLANLDIWLKNLVDAVNSFRKPANPAGFGSVDDKRISDYLGTDFEKFSGRLLKDAAFIWKRLKAALYILDNSLKPREEKKPLSKRLFDDVQKLREKNFMFGLEKSNGLQKE